MENQEKKTWGGARSGSGRKNKGGVHYYGFKAPQDIHEILLGIDGSKADFICRCIRRAWKEGER